MGAEKNDDATVATAATATADTATATTETAHEGAESSATTDTSATKPAAAAKPDTSKMSTLDILRAKKEERQSRAANTTATKPNGSEAASAKSADGKEAGGEVDLGSKDGSEGGDVDDDAVVKTIDMTKPGWFDRLKPEQRAALERKSPETVRLANAGKAEAQRYVELAKKKADTAKAPAKEATTQTADNKEAKAEADLSEAIDLLYDPKTKKQGLVKLLSDPDAVELIDARVLNGVKSTLQQLGIDLDTQVALQPLTEAIELASTKYPQLKTDDSFFDEVVALLEEDTETYEALMAEKNPRLGAAAIREASATVVRSRAAKKPADDSKATTATAAAATTKTTATNIGAARRDNLERNTQAARDAAGVKAGAAGSRTGSSTATAEPESTVELLRRQRQDKGYRFLGA